MNTLGYLARVSRMLADSKSPTTGSGSKTFTLLVYYAGEFDRARERYYREEKSRDIMNWVLEAMAVHNLLGPAVLRGTLLPNSPFTPESWHELEEKAAKLKTGIEDDYLLDRIDTWLLEAYSLKGRCETGPGDIVLDCGTFTGNTTLYFSQRVGDTGHVYGFEAGSATYATYEKNIAHLANVTPVHAAVYDHDGVISFRFDTQAGGQVVSPSQNAPTAEAQNIPSGAKEEPAVTIDNFVRSRGLQKVDFIKMDVEGAEKNALRGGAATIAAFHPKMALSAYHQFDDLFSLPDLVESIAPGVYSFVLRHFSDCLYETVLYCIPDHPEIPQKISPLRALPFTAQDKQYYREIIEALADGVQNTTYYFNLKGNTVDIRIAKSLMARVDEGTKMLESMMEENHRLKEENIALRRLLAKKGQ